MAETPFPDLRSVFHATSASPAEITAARELAQLAGAAVAASTGPGRGVNVALASRGWAKKLPPGAADLPAWMWLRLAGDGTGEIIASHASFLFAAVRLLATGTSELTHEKLAAGVLLPAT